VSPDVHGKTYDPDKLAHVGMGEGTELIVEFSVPVLEITKSDVFFLKSAVKSCVRGPLVNVTDVFNSNK
jgi:hypothetical protein